MLCATMFVVHAKDGARVWAQAHRTPNYYAVVTNSRKLVDDDLSSDVRTMLVRVTVYWKSGGDTDYCTRHGMSASGLPLVDGESVAVDPSIIPYGSRLRIPGYGTAKAVDTGSAVISRKASRACGSRAPVVDLFFDHRQSAEQWERENPAFVEATLL